MSKKRKVYFKGHYGFRNLGDDIFTVTADWLCNNLWLDIEPVFIGPHLPLLSTNARKYEIENRALRKAYEFVTSLTVTNVIHFGGSVRINLDKSIRDLRYFLYGMRYFRRKLGAIAVGLGPFPDDDSFQIMREYLEKFKFIMVRGYSSLAYVQKMGLQHRSAFCFDLAILLTRVYPKLESRPTRTIPERLRVGVSLCNYEKFTGGDLTVESQRESAVLRLLEQITMQYQGSIEELVLFEFNGHPRVGDAALVEKCCQMLENKVNMRIVKYSPDTEAFCHEINKCDCMVGMRLHSAIISYALGIPFLLVEYHPKCTEFLTTIGHRFRFAVDAPQQNLDHFATLVEQRAVPGVVDKSHFQDLLIAELKRVYELL